MRRTLVGQGFLRRGVIGASSLACQIALFVVPIVYLVFLSKISLVQNLDAVLRQAAPLVSSEASRQLQRTVSIGRLTSNLTVTSIVSMLRHPETVGTLAMTGEDVTIGARDSVYSDKKGNLSTFREAALAGSPIIARAARVNLFVSLPAVLSGDFSRCLTRVEIESPEITLVRDAKGQLSFMQIVKPNPNGKKSPPFRTFIHVDNGHLRFRDYASASSPGRVAQNDISSIIGDADLTSAADYRFAATALPMPHSGTALHLHGSVNVAGSWGRSNPGSSVDQPAFGSARFLVRMRANQADLPYWLYYFLNVGRADAKLHTTKDAFRLDHGVADVAVSLAGPRPEIKDGPLPGIAISLAAKFDHVNVSTDYLAAVPILDAHGTLDFADGSVEFNVGAKALGRQIDAAGELWGLAPAKVDGAPAAMAASLPSSLPEPELAVNFHADGLPVAKIIQAVVPRKTALPPGLRAAGSVSVDGLVSGPLKNVVATGRLSGLSLSYTGLPAAQGIAANLTYVNGVLAVTQATASLGNGGSLSGHGAFRLMGGGPGDVGSAQFAARATSVPLDSVEAIRRVSGARSNLAIHGTGDADVIGTRRGHTLSVAANVRTDGLSLGALAFPTARARVLVTQDAGQPLRLVVPAARLESPAGALRVAGNFFTGGRLNLSWSAAALDLRSLSHAVGFDRLEGMVSATGTVDGPVADPRVVIRELAGLNLRLDTGGGAAGAPSHQFLLDSLQAVNVVISRDGGIQTHNPVILRRYPAIATVTGKISDIFPAASSQARHPDPLLDLHASVKRLEIAEVQEQIAAVSASQAVKVQDIVAGATQPPASAVKPGLVTGSIASAQIVATGRVSDPQITATADFERMLFGEYPVRDGSIDLTYKSKKIVVRKASLSASIGTITANAVVLPDGSLSGTFLAPHLQIQNLSYLTKKVASIGGTVDVSGSFAGTQRHPVLTASVSASTMTVAGTTLADLVADNIKYDMDLDKGSSKVTVPLFSFRQPGPTTKTGGSDTSSATTASGSDTTLRLTDSVLTLPSGILTANLSARSGDIGVLLTTIANSGLRDTDFGSSIVQAIDGLPSIGGEFSIDKLTLGAQIVKKRGSDGKETYTLSPDSTGDATISGKDIRVGTFTAPIVSGHASLTGQTVLVDKLVATIPASGADQGVTVRSHGKFGFDGSVNAVVESNAVSIDSLRTIRQLRSVPLRGSFDVAVVVKRTEGGNTNITASLQGNNIDVLTGSNVIEVLGTPAEAQAPTFRLDQVRAEGEYVADAVGNATINIPEALVSHGNISLTVAGSVPLRTKATPTSASPDRNISLTATVPKIDLSELASLIKTHDKKHPEGMPADLSGAISASLSLTGTLLEPQLSGDVLLSKGHFTFPRPAGDDKDRINPIRNLDAHIVLNNGTVNVDTFLLALGGPNGQKGDFGTLSISGTAPLELSGVIEDALVGRKTGEQLSAEFLRDASLDLSGTFSNFRPVEDDLFGLGESVQSKINGTVVVKGSLRTPFVTTADNKPIEIADAILKLTPQPATTPKPAKPLVINPQFPTTGGGLPIAIDGKAIVTDGSSYRFEANGTATVTGALGGSGLSEGEASAASGLGVKAELNVLGGYYRMPTARFVVQRNNDITQPSTITLQYGGAHSGVFAKNIQAKTRLSVAAGTTISSTNRASQNSLLNIQNTAGSGATTTYTIQVTIGGPLNLLNDPNAPVSPDSGPTLTFVTDPYLSKDEIVSLLGAEQQVNQAASGNVSGAFTSLGYRYATQNLLPTALSPITNGIQSALGLEAFDVNYDPQGNSLVFVAKRFSESPPFNRFVAEYTQEIQTRSISQVTSQQPYLFSVSYDLFRLKATSKHLQPSIQIGVSNDYLNVNQFFLRGTMSF